MSFVEFTVHGSQDVVAVPVDMIGMVTKTASPSGRAKPVCRICLKTPMQYRSDQVRYLRVSESYDEIKAKIASAVQYRDSVLPGSPGSLYGV